MAAVLVAALLGLLLHFLVFRPLRSAPPLAKTVASVGVTLVLQAVIVLRFGTEDVTMTPVLPQKTIETLGGTVPVNQFILLGIVILIAIALALIYRKTRIGLATRAAAENERAAIFTGLVPSRLAAFNWVLASVVAGIVGILFASTVGLNPTDFVLFVVPALGAALLAGLDSFGIALAAGLLIGVLESLTLPLQLHLSWFPTTGAASGVPLVVIAIAMIVRGDRLPTRKTATEWRLPPAPAPIHPLRVGMVLVPLVLLGLVFLPFDLRGALVNSMAAVVLALSLVVVVGLAGQISLMQLAIAGVAAVAMTRIAGNAGIPFPLAPILSVACATVVGVVAGLPALRVRGVQLAILTLAAATTFEMMVLDNQSVVTPQDVSGIMPSPNLFGFNIGINSSFPFGSKGAPSAWYGILELIVVVIACWGVIRLRRSSLGLRFLAIRANERAAASVGIDVRRSKLLAFGIAAVLAGTAGVLYTYQFQGVSSDQYVALASITALALAYLGGITMVWGALWAGALTAGGLAFVLIARVYDLSKYEPLIAGLGLVLTALMNPLGIAGAMQQSVSSMKEFLRSRRAVASNLPAVHDSSGVSAPSLSFEAKPARQISRQ